MLHSIEQNVKQAYDKLAQPFERSRRRMHWPEVDAFLDTLTPGQSFVDIGCGTGRLCRVAEERQLKYLGVDVSGEMLKQAQEQCASGEFFQASMRHLPLSPNSFDAALLIASLHHLLSFEDRLEALEEAFKVTKPGGRLFMTNFALWRPSKWKLFLRKTGKHQLTPEDQAAIRYNDVFVPWTVPEQNEVVYRYYHVFTKGEVKRLFKASSWELEELYYVHKGKRVPFYQASNLVAVARKVVQ